MQALRFVLLALIALLCSDLDTAWSVQSAAQDPAEKSAAQEPRAATIENTSKPSTRASSPSSKENKSKKKRAANKSKAAGPRKVVVRNGSTGDSGGELTAGISAEEAERRKEATERLLQSTDTNLKTFSAKQLTSDQAATVRTINSYMEQSRNATKDGDLQRAKNLAFKAHLLSDSLLRK